MRERWGRSWQGGPFRGERYGTTLRWLEAGGHECVRMVALVVRDRAWRTLLPEPRSVRTRSRADGGLRIEARTHVGPATLAWRLDVAPRAQGLEVSATITAERDVMTNRAGLVVLLPAAVYCGARYTARHSNGTATRGQLPRAIAPHQPLVDVASARIAARDGTTLALTFRGEVFEMEDQRNWLDPTFKLYGRALARPIPYRIGDGARVEQSVSIDLERTGAARRARRRGPRSGRLPSIGVATAPGRVPRDAQSLDALREIDPGFILHRTDAQGSGVAAAGALAGSLDAALRLECFGAGAALEAAVARARPAALAHYFAAPAAQRALRRRATRSARVGGTFSDFVMLNRNGVDDGSDRVTFALCPTIHARDDRSLIETLDALPDVFAHAKRIAAARPIDAGPCSLLRRLVPRTGRPAERPRSTGGIPYDVDSRQHEPITAAWLACVVAVAAATGAASLCTFEASGARGIVAASRRSFAHAVLAAFADARRRTVRLHAIDAGVGAAFSLDGELWLVDLSGRARLLPFALGPSRRTVRARDGCAWSPLRRAMRLAPYGIARFASFDRTIASAWCESAEAPA